MIKVLCIYHDSLLIDGMDISGAVYVCVCVCVCVASMAESTYSYL